MATIWSALAEMMVLVGDLLAVVAAGAGLLALVGVRRQWSRHNMRQIWSNGIVATVLVVVGLAAKVSSAERAAAANGYVFGFSNAVVGVLVTVGIALLGAAYWSWRQEAGGGQG